MPGSMDGWQLADAIRQLRPQVRLLYTTGYANLSPKNMGSFGSIHLLEKPYRLSKLAHMIRHALSDAP